MAKRNPKGQGREDTHSVLIKINIKDKYLIDHIKSKGITIKEILTIAMRTFYDSTKDGQNKELEHYNSVMLEKENCYGSASFKLASLEFGENMQFSRMKRYCYQLLINHGLQSKEPIIKNINAYSKLFQFDSVKESCAIFLHNVENHFNMMYEYVCEGNAIAKKAGLRGKNRDEVIDSMVKLLPLEKNKIKEEKNGSCQQT